MEVFWGIGCDIVGVLIEKSDFFSVVFSFNVFYFLRVEYFF